MFPLRLLLHRFVRRGHLGVIDHTGRLHEFGTLGARPAAVIRLHDPALYRRLALHPTLHVGRAYVDGTLTIAEGQLSDFLNLLLINEQLASHTGPGGLKRRLEELTRLAAVVNPPERARRNVHHHYDHAANFYRYFLDEDLQYSCAYFANEALSLEEAQEAKKRHIAAKLDLRPGHRVLDIGCGFGGMALFLARNYGVHVTGITLSTEQLNTARERAAKQAFDAPGRFQVRGLSPGAAGHSTASSPSACSSTWGGRTTGSSSRAWASSSPTTVWRCVHTIGRQTPPVPINAWIRENIFPGRLPADAVPAVAACWRSRTTG